MDDNAFDTTSQNSNYIQEPSDFDLLALELRDRLTVFKKRPPNFKKTPVIYISSNSSAAEVQDWLRQKDFDETTCHHLKGLNGEEMFNLKKSQLQTFCGHDEGSRLYSQLLLSRTVTQFNPSKSIELCEKLAKAKKKADLSEEQEL